MVEHGHDLAEKQTYQWMIWEENYDEVKGRRKQSWTILSYYHSIPMEDQEMSEKTLIRVFSSLSRSELGPFQMQVSHITTPLFHSVPFIMKYV